jgi:hypothetical protein
MQVDRKENMPTHLGKLQKEEVEQLRHRLAQGRQQLAKDSAEAQRLRQQVDEYQLAFDKITSATGFKDVDSFVTQFLDIEDENFHRFQYLNTLNAEHDALKEEIDSLRNHELEHTNSTAATEQKWEQMVSSMEQHLERVREQTNEQEDKISSTVSTVSQLAAKVGQLYSMLFNDAESRAFVVDTGDEVAESKLMDQIGAIEHKATQLVRIHGALNSTDVAVPVTSSREKPSVRLGRELPSLRVGDEGFKNIIPPPIRDAPFENDFFKREYTDDPEDEKPFEERELRVKVEMYLHEQDQSKTKRKPAAVQMLGSRTQSIKPSDKVSSSRRSPTRQESEKSSRISFAMDDFAVDHVPQLMPQPQLEPQLEQAEEQSYDTAGADVPQAAVETEAGYGDTDDADAGDG